MDKLQQYFEKEFEDMCKDHDEYLIKSAFTDLGNIIKADNERWWTNIHTGENLNRNTGEIFMLIVSEISEALEADRKNLMDDKLPNRHGVEVELADAVIRIMDFCAQKNYDLVGAILEKLEYNRHREDHKTENRLKENGKKY